MALNTDTFLTTSFLQLVRLCSGFLIGKTTGLFMFGCSGDKMDAIASMWLHDVEGQACLFCLRCDPDGLKEPVSIKKRMGRMKGKLYTMIKLADCS